MRTRQLDLLDQRISREFQVDLANASSPSRPNTRQNSGPSPMVHFENYKKEAYQHQAEQNRRSIVARQGSHAQQSEDIKKHDPEEFLQEVSAFERQIQDCSRLVRLEHLGKDPKEAEADRLREERKTQADWEEAELRKLRKKEQMARDPHRKIQLRLENKRRFEMDTLDKAGIPMQTIDFGGGKGLEAITLVDVRQLQTKCQGLNEPGGVRAMLELQEHREKTKKMERTSPMATLKLSSPLPSPNADGSDGLATSESQPNLGGLDRTKSVLSESWDARLPGVEKKKRDIHQAKVERHLETFRQPMPSWFPHDLCGGSLQSNRNMKATVMHLMKANREFRHKNIGVLNDFFADEGNIGSKHKSPDGGCPRSRLEHQPEAERPEATPQVKAKVTQCWRKVRGFVNLLKVYFRHMRELDSIRMVKALTKQMSEWARIKRAMTRLLTSVKFLQRACRDFLLTRDKRVAIMSKDWQRVEDHYLQQYFKVYAVHCVEEHQQKVEQDMMGGLSAWAKAHPEQSMSFKRAKTKTGNPVKHSKEETEGLLAAVLDWKNFRVPPQHRKAVVTRYYMIQLMRRVRNEEQVLKTVVSMVKWERELVDYLKTFGAENLELDDPADSSMADRCTQEKQEFWYFPEKVILDSICTAAQAMKSIVPWNEHPGNKAQVLPDECFDKFCRPPRVLTKDVRQALQAEIRGTWRSFQNFGLRRRSMRCSTNPNLAAKQLPREEEDRPDGANERKVKIAGGNLDDLFSTFTPRSALAPTSEQLQKKDEGESTLWPAVPKLRRHI